MGFRDIDTVARGLFYKEFSNKLDSDIPMDKILNTCISDDFLDMKNWVLEEVENYEERDDMIDDFIGGMFIEKAIDNAGTTENLLEIVYNLKEL